MSTSDCKKLAAERKEEGNLSKLNHVPDAFSFHLKRDTTKSILQQ